MKATRVLALALAGVLVLTAVGLAQEGTAPAGRDRARRGARGRGQPMLERLVKALELTAEQQTQIKQILETQKQAAENWMKEHGEELKGLREEMQKAREAKDREAMRAAMEKMRALQAKRGEGQKSVHDQIAAALTDEQKAKFEKMRPRRSPMRRGPLGAIGALDLTAEQKAQVKTIMDAAKADAEKVDNPEAKRKIMQDALAKVRNTVLTDEQKAKLAKMREQGPGRPRQGTRRRGEPFGGLDLTDEQKAKVKEIMTAARKAAGEAEGREARREIFRNAQKKIQSEVLTEEQRAKAAKAREERMKNRRERRGGRRGRRAGEGQAQ